MSTSRKRVGGGVLMWWAGVTRSSLHCHYCVHTQSRKHTNTADIHKRIDQHTAEPNAVVRSGFGDLKKLLTLASSYMAAFFFFACARLASKITPIHLSVTY